MDTVAIISEYNPFHKGHSYQISEVRKQLNNPTVISIMSPNFVQRGYPAIFDKYIRGECALKGGVDLAISMPLVFALLSAEGFAECGVKLAGKVGANYLSFGVEDDDKVLLEEVTELLLSPAFESEIKDEIKLNPESSYPTVRAKAVKKLLGSSGFDFINKPNNILAVEYNKAIKRYAPEIKVLPVKRTGNAHHDVSCKGDFLSATAIRSLINDRKEYFDFIPSSVKETLKNAVSFDYDEYEKFLYSVLFTKSREDILKYVSNKELANIIKKAAEIYPTYELFRTSLSRKKYTETKIDRMLISILLEIPFEKYYHKEPEYVTLLAMNDKGKKALSKLRKSDSLTVLSRGADCKKYPHLSGMETEIFADRIYSRCLKSKEDGSYFYKKKPYKSEVKK